MKRTKVKGANIPGTVEDDGIRVVHRFNLNDVPEGWAPTPVDPLDTAMDAARRYLEHVAAWDPATRKAAGPGKDCAQRNDERAAWRLHAELDNLRAALDGGDVRHAARVGVSFGKALEEMRVRLCGSAVRLGRMNDRAVKYGRKINTAKRETLDAMALEAYEEARRAKPNLDSERALCADAAIILNKEHADARATALEEGMEQSEVDKHWPKWTMSKVKARVPRAKKEQK